MPKNLESLVSENMDLREYLVKCLRSEIEKLCAAEIKKKFDIAESKSEINKQLYSLKKDKILESVEGTPPKWYMREADQSIGTIPPDCKIEPLIHVVVDLGNCHDCLKQLIPYAQKGLITVSAYADIAFCGFGISPPINDTENVTVFQADTPDKNSADVQIIWDLSRLTHQQPEKSEKEMIIIVATKDLGFRRLKNLVEQNPKHSLFFVTNWESLRIYIE